MKTVITVFSAFDVSFCLPVGKTRRARFENISHYRSWP